VPVDFYADKLEQYYMYMILFIRGLPIFFSFSWQLPGTVANPWGHSDPGYPMTFLFTM